MEQGSTRRFSESTLELVAWMKHSSVRPSGTLSSIGITMKGRTMESRDFWSVHTAKVHTCVHMVFST